MTHFVKKIAQTFQAYLNCKNDFSGTKDGWQQQHKENIEKMVKTWLPSGAGFDSGTAFDFDRSTVNRLVFRTSYHHMSEHGYYDGWTTHDIIVTPCLWDDFELKVMGNNKNDIREWVYDVFDDALRKEMK